MTESSQRESAVGELAADELWVLMDDPHEKIEGELARFRGRQRFSTEALGEHLQQFTTKISKSLSKIHDIGSGFELAEVSVHTTLTAEVGFELVAKAGIEGGITLTFRRAKES